MLACTLRSSPSLSFFGLGFASEFSAGLLPGFFGGGATGTDSGGSRTSIMSASSRVCLAKPASSARSGEANALRVSVLMLVMSIVVIVPTPARFVTSLTATSSV